MTNAAADVKRSSQDAMNFVYSRPRHRMVSLFEHESDDEAREDLTADSGTLPAMIHSQVAREL